MPLENKEIKELGLEWSSFLSYYSVTSQLTNRLNLGACSV